MINTPCQHLENLLPQMQDGDAPQYIGSDKMASFTCNVFQAYLPSFDLGRFKDTLRHYGFIEKWDVELLVSKYYYSMSNRQIEAEFGYVSRETVRRRLKSLHEQLVERGFKPKGKK